MFFCGKVKLEYGWFAMLLLKNWVFFLNSINFLDFLGFVPRFSQGYFMNLFGSQAILGVVRESAPVWILWEGCLAQKSYRIVELDLADALERGDFGVYHVAAVICAPDGHVLSMTSVAKAAWLPMAEQRMEDCVLAPDPQREVSRRFDVLKDFVTDKVELFQHLKKNPNGNLSVIADEGLKNVEALADALRELNLKGELNLKNDAKICQEI
jgi:hypothetical protein